MKVRFQFKTKAHLQPLQTKHDFLKLVINNVALPLLSVSCHIFCFQVWNYEDKWVEPQETRRILARKI